MSLKLTHRPSVVVYGKKCFQNRDVRFFSDESSEYNYSKSVTSSYPLTNKLREMLEYVNQTIGDDFNGILVNRYENGSDYIGAHRDTEDTLGKNGVVGIVYVTTKPRKLCLI